MQTYEPLVKKPPDKTEDGKTLRKISNTTYTFNEHADNVYAFE
jgi:hypothetical protein